MGCCLNCGEPAKKKFCSHRCSAVYSHAHKPRKRRTCQECGSLHKNGKFCSHKCQQIHKEKKFISEWKNGLCSGMAPHGGLNEPVRRYILSKYGEKCSQCGWSEVNPRSGKVPVQIDHIDGDFRNCSEDNLTVLCPNCHSLTPTYMTLNLGRGRDMNGSRRKKAGLAQPIEHVLGTHETAV